MEKAFTTNQATNIATRAVAAAERVFSQAVKARGGHAVVFDRDAAERIERASDDLKRAIETTLKRATRD